MTLASADYFARGDAQAPRIGALFRDVPVPFFSGTRLVTVRPSGDTGLTHHDFTDVWQRISPSAREGGLPLLQRAKLRPAILLRVGAAMVDDVHQNDLWMAPIYGDKDKVRSGPNIFPLPAFPDVGLSKGFVDFYQLLLVPRQHLGPRQYICDLTPLARKLLLGALVSWIQADPPP